MSSNYRNEAQLLDPIIYVAASIFSIIIGFFIGIFFHRNNLQKSIDAAQSDSEKILEEAHVEKEQIIKEAHQEAQQKHRQKDSSLKWRRKRDALR